MDYARLIISEPRINAASALWQAGAVSPGVVLLVYAQVRNRLLSAAYTCIG